MLNLILGVSGTGKTSLVLAQLKQRAGAGRRSLLLVPEQFTSSAETMVYTALGDRLCAETEVYSFTSYAEAVLKRCGGVAVRTLTDAGRVVMVRRAMDSLADALEVYRRHRRSMGFCTMCADAIKELKTAGAAPEALLDAAGAAGADRAKLRELGLIFGAYEGLLHGLAMDPSDRVTAAAGRLDAEMLRDTAVFIDNFDGFTAPEYALLAKLMTAEACTVTLCCPELADHEDGMGLFSPVQRTAARLRQLAGRRGVPVAVPVLLDKDLRHAETPVLRAVNDILCGLDGPAAAELAAAVGEQAAPAARDGFFVTPGQGVYDECKTAAAQIALLAAAGVRYRDMAVICRLMDDYKAPLQYELGLAGIPFFTDETETLEHTAPAAFCRAALALAAKGLTSEGVLRLLKTDLCGFAAEDVAALENYAYTWPLRAADWRAPFTRSPAGFGTQLREEDAAQLARAEAVRAAAMPKLDAFLDAVRGADALRLTKQLYLLLEAFGGGEHTLAAAAALRAQGDDARADAVLRAYNGMMALLDELANLLGTDEVTAGEYDELLALLLRASDMGSVPQTQNAVLVTTADRMRLASPQYCFVLGTAEGAFPKTVGYSGLLTHADRTLLVEHGIEMPGSYENRTLLEQMFFYKALTAPARGLYVSAVAPEAGGAPLCAALTPLLDALQPGALALPLAARAETPAAALDVLGAQFRTDTPETAALAEALRGQEALAAMERAAVPQPFAAHDTAALAAVLGRGLALSPTRVEQFYKCRFAYFLQFVLGVRPRKKAELSPMETGTLVHYILEHALREAGAAFPTLSPAEVRALAFRVADEYVAENMPDISARFAYLIGRLKENAARLLTFLQQEQAQSSFHPVAFEQPIGFDEGALPPMTLHTPDGRTVRIIGQIDRVDTMQREGRTYVRVVDYKTGEKTFRLDDVFCGLNTQMLFYLFTLCAGRTDTVPAGVLYLAGDPSPKSALREDAAAPLAYHVDGLVLNDPVVLRGMDREASGVFVPCTFTKDGAPRASAKLAGLEKLGNIERHLEKLAVDMAAALYGGEIAADPLCGSLRPCDVCDYLCVCRHENGMAEHAVKAPKNVFETAAAEETAATPAETARGAETAASAAREGGDAT